MIQKLFFILLFGLLAIPTWSQDSENTSAWDEANTLYASGNYSGAINKYEAIPDFEKRAGVLYNIALAYHKSGQLGKSILSLERARQLEPANEKVLHNLTLAQQQIENPYSDNSFILIKVWKNIANWFSPNIWAFLWLAVLAIAVYFISIKLFKKQTKIASLWISCSLGLIVGLLLLQSLKNTDNSHFGIAIKTAESYYADKAQEQIIEKSIPEGTKVQILNITDDLVQIQLPNGVVAFVDAAFIQTI